MLANELPRRLIVSIDGDNTPNNDASLGLWNAYYAC
jgi:hypothetical protein